MDIELAMLIFTGGVFLGGIIACVICTVCNRVNDNAVDSENERLLGVIEAKNRTIKTLEYELTKTRNDISRLIALLKIDEKGD